MDCVKSDMHMKGLNNEVELAMDRNKTLMPFCGILCIKFCIQHNALLRTFKKTC